ncbi:MAG: 4Fe-4S dicluster domain-containing protein [Betaproteobacteria bacterium]|nr:4Fe-4S dicluster domain-containing protein [Betaproteobacteria bacterium]
MSTKPMHTTHQALHALSPLRFDDTACRSLRGPYGGCRACAQACPAGVLAVDARSVVLKDGCLGCGRCTAACPTGALRIDSFEAEQAGAASGPVRVDCWKAPARQEGLRVPCLGGLSAGRLLQLWGQARGRGLQLIDHGWCRQCSAGAGERHAATRALARAQECLLVAGADKDSLPRLLSEPLPASRMPAAIPEAALERKVSRRHFFRAVVAQAAEATEAARPPVNTYQAYRSRVPQERRRLLDGVGEAARAAGRPLPASLFADLRADAACDGKGVCTRICPTGALSLHDVASGARALVFDAAGCIACGCCVRACPEQALHLDAAPYAPLAPLAPSELRRWRVAECADCGAEYPDAGGEEMCMTCRTGSRLIKDACDALHGARP